VLCPTTSKRIGLRGPHQTRRLSVGGGAEEKDPFAWVGDGFSKDFTVQGETAQAERQAERQALRLASPPSRAPHPLISLDALYSELSPSPQTNNDIPRGTVVR
jgi:hypothetical protein